jgi:hypothetical protein
VIAAMRNNDDALNLETKCFISLTPVKQLRTDFLAIFLAESLADIRNLAEITATS